MTRTLREGFTTGTAAAAAAKAAALHLLTGAASEHVDVPLPAGGRLRIAIAICRREGPGARATVIKDGGDDPDATHGAAIESLVVLEPFAFELREGAACQGGSPLSQTLSRQRNDFPGPSHLQNALDNLGFRSKIYVTAGRGVGMVTRPGLPVPPGQPAINPAPRRQISDSVREAMEAVGFRGSARVLVEVPDGEIIARRTLNPRLGITGGISILGTRGTVRPYSHEAWAATVSQSLDVARAAGLSEACCSTGGRSERLLMALRPDLPEVAFIQAADHFAHAMAEAGRKGFTRVTWGVFFGKLVKQAQGLPQTHARNAPTDMRQLAGLCATLGASAVNVDAVARANTAMHALDILQPDPALPAILQELCRLAADHARSFAGTDMEVRHVLFSLEGKLLAQWPSRIQDHILHS